MIIYLSAIPGHVLSAALCVVLFFFTPGNAHTGEGTVTYYSYDIVKTYPHDPQAFTQGLVWDEGAVYEGTGKFGRSSLRRVNLVTGQAERQLDCPKDTFGEGIAILGDTLYQLTWKNRRILVYDKHDFTLVQSFDYPRQGWGLTHNNQDLIASDGSSTLYFLDPKTFAEKKKITVHDATREIAYLNELEYIDNRIYANIYRSNRIAIINPDDGLVEAWIELAGLRNQLQLDSNEAVLNGIMYDAKEGRLFVTGKFWPTLFEINLVPKQ